MASTHCPRSRKFAMRFPFSGHMGAMHSGTARVVKWLTLPSLRTGRNDELDQVDDRSLTKLMTDP